MATPDGKRRKKKKKKTTVLRPYQPKNQYTCILIPSVITGAITRRHIAILNETVIHTKV